MEATDADGSEIQSVHGEATTVRTWNESEHEWYVNISEADATNNTLLMLVRWGEAKSEATMQGWGWRHHGIARAGVTERIDRYFE